ncbi:MAG: hypothetical protein JWO78_615 [Micavibrio sp.]|nr:hypothetical protein [Micavibrio sp.]
MTRQTRFFRTSHTAKQRGNATIYVLIVVALFAALSFVLSRQNDSSEGGHITNERADIIAGDIIAYPSQVKQALDMMIMSGTSPSDFNFTQSGQIGFTSAPSINKVFHPDGGGLTLAQIPAGAIAQSSTNPKAGWYLSEFSNVGWSESSDNDVILVAYQLSKDICQRINLRMTGSRDIPVLNNTIPNLLIAKESPPGVPVHSGSNVDFDASACSACNRPAQCVSETGPRYGFYSVVISR